MKYHGWSLLELYPELLWPLGVISTLALACFIAFRPARKRGNNSAKYLTVILPLVGWAIWHFYPSLTFKGTYSGEVQTHMDSEPMTFRITIDDSSFCTGNDGQQLLNYELDPFLRVLWLGEAFDGKQFGAKLGWNSVTYSYFKIGPVKHLKQKNSEPAG